VEVINHKAIQISESKTIRLAQIYWLSMILPHVDDDRELGNVIDDYDTDYDEIAHAFGFTLDDNDLFDRIINDHRFGFLAKIERPVMEKHGYSWGHYNCTWIYSENLDDLLLKAQEVAELMDKK
jgi:hypothetical protein